MQTLCFPMPWSEESILHDVKENVVARWLVMDDGEGRVQAYAGMWFVLDEAHVCNVAVHPDFRRRGIAEALVTGLVEELKNNGSHCLTLEVRASNTPARSLYEKMGFSAEGEWAEIQRI